MVSRGRVSRSIPVQAASTPDPQAAACQVCKHAQGCWGPSRSLLAPEPGDLKRATGWQS